MPLRRPLVLLVILVLALVLAPSGVPADPALDLRRARQFHEQERWAASESLATAALAALEAAPRPDSLAIAEAAYLLGHARWRRVGFTDGSGIAATARALGIRERRLGPDDLQVAEAHLLLSRFLHGTDRTDSAVVHVRRAIAIREARLAPDDTLVAKAWDQLAVFQRDRRDFAAALDAWGRAIDIRKRAHGPEHPEVARLIAQTGVPWMELGDFDRAREVLEQSLAIFARTAGPDYVGRWIPLNILADLENHAGDNARRLDLLLEALRIVRLAYGENAREALSVKHNLAHTLSEFGDYAGARALHASVLPVAEIQYGPTHPRTLIFRQSLAYWNLKLGETEIALRDLRLVDSVMSARQGPPARDHSFVQALEAEALIKSGRSEEALAVARRSFATEQASRQPAPGALVNTQMMLILAGEAAGDTAEVERAGTELERIDAKYALGGGGRGADIRYFRAHGARWLGRRGEAWTLALEAERRGQDDLRMNLRSLPDRRGLQLAREHETYLGLLVDLADGQEGREPGLVLDLLVRSRGLVGAELARRRAPAGFEADSQVVKAHARWVERQLELARRTVRMSAGRADSAARVQLDALRASADSAEAVYARTLAARSATLDTAVVGLAEVQARLAPGQALVAFVQSRSFRPGHSGGDTSVVTAFVARGGRDEVDVVRLGPSSAIVADLDPWRERLVASPGSSARPGGRAESECRRLGRAARARTWDRIAPLVAGQTDVFLVGDGPLLELPWQALPDGERGYLVEAGPRVHVLHAERELIESPSPPAGSGSLLAVGAPDFDRAGTETPPGAAFAAAMVRSAPDPCSGSRLTALGPLPGSGAEAEQVARTWRSMRGGDALVLSGPGATEQAFKRQVRGRTIVHIATHGIVAGDTCATGIPGRRGVGGVEPVAAAMRPTAAVRPQAGAKAAAAHAPSPWVSRRVWLALAGANRAGEQDTDENEGFLTAEEVVTLELAGTDWVVLSACHSGAAEAWTREGAQGMRRAFHLAGARTVIASQWAVEDQATREWMQELYAERARGSRSGAAAAASASRAILARRRQEGRSTHPFYWAAFTSTGR